MMNLRKAEIFTDLCQIFNFNKQTQQISYEEDVYSHNCNKSFLFKFCFLKEKGFIKFENLSHLWIFNEGLDDKEVEISLNLIVVLISKIQGTYMILNKNNNFIIELVKSLLNLNKKETINIFIYLQSVYSANNQLFENVIYPLSYTLGFNKDFLKNNLIKDIKNIIDDIIRKNNYNFDRDLDYSNISLNFLKYINFFIHLANEGTNKEEIKELLFLCNYNLDNKESFTIDLNNEYLNYFNIIKDIIIEFSKKSNSSDEFDKNKISPKKINEIPLENHNELVGKDFFIGVKFIKVSSLCQEIRFLLNKFEIQEENINNYFEMKVENLNNQILITKLSNTISVLKNANNLNIKRRLIESLFFEIYSKFSNYFSFSNKYKPSHKNLNLLNKLLEKALKNCSSEDEKIIINNDIQKLGDFINEKNIFDENSTIKINSFDDDNSKKLYVIMEFLGFCKSNLKPSIQSNDKNIDYYLLPSNIEDKKYIFTYDDLIKQSKEERKDEENKDNFEIRKINKTLSLQYALNIIFSLDIKEFEENFEDVLSYKKKKLEKNIEIFKKYANAFKNDSENILYKEYSDIDKEKIPSEFLLALNNYDALMKKILNNEINSNEAIEIIEKITKFICSEVNDAIKSIEEKEKENIEYKELNNLLTKNTNKMLALYNFVKNLYDEFFYSLKKIYENYITSLESIIEKGNNYRKQIKCLFNDETDLFKLWILSNPKIEVIYSIEENLIDIFKQFIQEIRLNVHLTFDEKTILWCIKNGFDKYLVND